ncbi:MAG: hypothetical protein ABIJ08_07215 [Nanoarchaeota archaeon]
MKNKRKLVSISLIIILIINLVLFALKKIPQIYFWLMIGIIALIAYKVMPKLKT